MPDRTKGVLEGRNQTSSPPPLTLDLPMPGGPASFRGKFPPPVRGACRRKPGRGADPIGCARLGGGRLDQGELEPRVAGRIWDHQGTQDIHGPVIPTHIRRPGATIAPGAGAREQTCTGGLVQLDRPSHGMSDAKQRQDVTAEHAREVSHRRETRLGRQAKAGGQQLVLARRRCAKAKDAARRDCRPRRRHRLTIDVHGWDPRGEAGEGNRARLADHAIDLDDARVARRSSHRFEPIANECAQRMSQALAGEHASAPDCMHGSEGECTAILDQRLTVLTQPVTAHEVGRHVQFGQVQAWSRQNHPWAPESAGLVVPPRVCPRVHQRVVNVGGRGVNIARSRRREGPIRTLGPAICGRKDKRIAGHSILDGLALATPLGLVHQ